jgi:hypothetical protein
MAGLRHPLAQRRQSQPWMLGQLRTNQSLGAAQTALAAAPMGLWRTTAGSAPALPQLLNKGEAHRKSFGNLRLALLVRDQGVDDAFA